VRTPVAQCLLCGGEDGCGRDKIRLADFHVHNVTTLRFKFARAGEQGHDVKRLDIR